MGFPFHFRDGVLDILKTFLLFEFFTSHATANSKTTRLIPFLARLRHF